MAEFVSGSLDTVIFWEAKTLFKKRTEDPFASSACHLSSLVWSASSILINAHSVTMSYTHNIAMIYYPQQPTCADSKLVVVPKQGDRIALCEFPEGIPSWTHLNHLVSNRLFTRPRDVCDSV